MADFRVDSPHHGGYPPWLDPPDPPADQADIRHGWADSPIIFSLQSSQSPGRYYCAWLPCVPFSYIYIITMRAGSQTKRQRRNKRTSPTSSENNSTESEREMEEVGTSEHNIQVESDSDEIPGGGKEASGSVHVVSKHTKCWLFF